MEKGVENKMKNVEEPQLTFQSIELLERIWMAQENCSIDETFFLHTLNLGFRWKD